MGLNLLKAPYSVYKTEVQVTTIVIFLTLVQCKDETLVRSCPSDQQSWNTAARRKECQLENSREYMYHCLKNQHKQLVEACLVPSWIERGICPILFDSGDFGGETCTSRRGQTCPKDNFRSNKVYLYPVCFGTTSPAENRTTKPSNGIEKRNISIENTDTEHIHGLRYTPVVSTFAALLVSLMTFWTLYLYYKMKYIKQKAEAVIDEERERLTRNTEQAEAVIDEERERLTKNTEHSYKRTQIVPLSIYMKGIKIIEQTGILIITGRMGSGKTTTMEYFRRIIMEKSVHWEIKNFSGNETYESSEKWILILDDCFGKFVANPVSLKDRIIKLKTLLPRITQNKENRKAIITMSDHEFSYFCSSLSTDDCEVEQCRLCLDKLEEKEKKLIFDYVFKVPRFNISRKPTLKKQLQRIDKESVAFHSLGWPLICRLALIPDITSDIDNFSKNPFQCLMGGLEKMKSSDEQLYCAMVYALFKGGDVSKLVPKEGDENETFLRNISKMFAQSMLPPESANQSSPNADKSMNKSDEFAFIRKKLSRIYIQAPHFFERKGPERFQFHHGIFELGLLCHLYRTMPEFTINHLDISLITELFRPKDYTVEFYELDIIHLCHFESQINKETKEVEAGNSSHKHVNETPTWMFTLEEYMFSYLIKRIPKDKIMKVFRDHPILSDSAFRFFLNKK